MQYLIVNIVSTLSRKQFINTPSLRHSAISRANIVGDYYLSLTILTGYNPYSWFVFPTITYH